MASRIGVYTLTNCPSCGGAVSLIGNGRPGERAHLTGTCRNGHPVFAHRMIPQPGDHHPQPTERTPGMPSWFTTLVRLLLVLIAVPIGIACAAAISSGHTAEAVLLGIGGMLCLIGRAGVARLSKPY